MVTGTRVVSVWAAGPWCKPPAHLEGISTLANEVSWPLSYWSPTQPCQQVKDWTRGAWLEGSRKGKVRHGETQVAFLAILTLDLEQSGQFV